jgi:hypothetical protein
MIFGVRHVVQKKDTPEACRLIVQIGLLVGPSGGSLYAHPVIWARDFAEKRQLAVTYQQVVATHVVTAGENGG